MKAFVETEMYKLPEEDGDYIVVNKNNRQEVSSQSFSKAYGWSGGNLDTDHLCWLREVDSDDVRRILQDEHKIIGTTWCKEDVWGHAKSKGVELTDEQLSTVCEYMNNNHDASIGTNWDSIQSALEECYPEIDFNNDDDFFTDDEF